MASFAEAYPQGFRILAISQHRIPDLNYNISSPDFAVIAERKLIQRLKPHVQYRNEWLYPNSRQQVLNAIKNVHEEHNGRNALRNKIFSGARIKALLDYEGVELDESEYFTRPEARDPMPIPRRIDKRIEVQDPLQYVKQDMFGRPVMEKTTRSGRIRYQDPSSYKW